MESLAYYNGVFGSPDEIKVPFNDRSHFFGDGVYDVTYSKNHKPFAIEEHLDRFFRSAAKVGIKVPCDRERLTELLLDMMSRVDDGEQFVYWQVTRGTQKRDHTYPDDLVGNLWIFLQSSHLKDLSVRVKARTAPDTRFYHCDIKTINLLPSVMYAQDAKEAGVYETILYREGGRVTECGHSNVHIINAQGVLQTAPTDNLILPGIARAHLIGAATALGYPVSETPFTLDEMFAAREVIVTSSGSLCLACSEVDGKPVGGGAPEMLSRLGEYLLDEFNEATK